MADPLYELLAPYLDNEATSVGSQPSQSDHVTTSYLTRLTTLSLGSLTTTEPASLTQSSQSVLRSLQALSKRSHRSVISATDHLSNLSSLLLSVNAQAVSLRDGFPAVETAASDFARKYDRNTENTVLDRRKKAMLLNSNVDRVGNILELPTLLSTTVSSSAAGAGAGTAGAAASGYASALDIHAHVKRLKALYPDSDLVRDVAKQSDEEIQNLITVLISTLQSPALKLAAAMRTIGWLRRVAPDLANSSGYMGNAQKQNSGIGLVGQGNEEGSLGALFLVCRLTTLRRTLEALDPLKELADQESAKRVQQRERWTGGAQTERYLKRYIEVFREQSFAIISMYKSIFPSALPAPDSAGKDAGPFSPSNSISATTKSPSDGTKAMDSLTSASGPNEDFSGMPSALATFAPHVVDMLFDTLRMYMPNVVERSSRDSLLTQILYCAGSLGRLGADFGMMLAILEDELSEQDAPVDNESQDEAPEMEWVQVMKKHRIQASRLELLASGAGSGGRKGSATPLEIRSLPPVSSA